MLTAQTCWFLWICVGITMLTTIQSYAAYTIDNGCGARISFCPDVHNVSGGLAFVDEFPPQPMLQKMACFYLSCCVGDRPQVNTSWYKWLPEISQWDPLTSTSENCVDEGCYRYTADHGQSLIFSSPGVLSDTGLYFCAVSDGHNTLNRTFDVRVISCGNKPDIKFTQPSDLQASVGSIFSQDCTGDFGCFGAVANGNLAWWSYRDEDGRLMNLSVGTHGHYEVHDNVSWDETKKSSVLTIQGVKKEDFKRTFFCHLKMGDQPPVGFNFSLTETESFTEWRTHVSVIIGLCVPAILLLAAGVLTYKTCFPVVAFRVKSLTKQLPRREARHTHDVMLVSREDAENGNDDEEDTRVLRSLEKMLTDKGFHVLHQPLTGARIGRLDSVQYCVSVILVISTPGLRQLKEAYLPDVDFLFSNAAGERTEVIFVSTQPMTSQEWGALSRDYQKAYTNTPSICAVLTWPGEEGESSWLRRANFWYQLQCFLPKPRRRSMERVATEGSGCVDEDGCGEGGDEDVRRLMAGLCSADRAGYGSFQ